MDRGEAPRGNGISGSATPMPHYTAGRELIEVLDASPDFHILLAEDQTILFANAAFHAANPDEAGPLTGQSLAASLLGLDARRAASRRIILDTVRCALATGRVTRAPIFRYDVQKTREHPPREAWWSLSASPLDLNGRPSLLLTSHEVTSAVREVRGEAEPEPAGGGSLVWAERRRLGQIFDQTTDLMSLVVGPDHVFELINPAARRLFGEPQLLGRSIRDVVWSDRGRDMVRRMDEVRRTGQPYMAQAVSFRMKADDEEHFLDITLQPLTNDDGAVEAIFCRGQDVTRQVRDRAVQSFLREELAHCQGNTLAVVLALAEQSAVHAGSLEQFRAIFAGRLAALAAVNAALTTEGPDVSLAGLLRGVAQRTGMAARLGGSGGGATLRPKAAITLGLMFHELLQISNPEPESGSTTPRIRAHQRAGCLHLIWISPLARDFGQTGDHFAHRLFDHAVRHEFGGRWRVIRRERVSAFCFEFPLGHSAWTRSGAAS